MCECGHHYDLHSKAVSMADFDLGLSALGCEVCGCPGYRRRHDPYYDPDDVADQGYNDEGYPYSGMGKVRR